ncbi:hypothetical protein [Allochromatium palmeri]|uniref:hypothetical protein n=1 Tax=Allochromatium palmeri TaxID=231048 RepID=UPI0016432C78|nr:hypothetical protein [Allochromatium palmeri]
MTRKRLLLADIAALSSTYLTEGRKQESWAIEWIEIEGDQLWAKVVMTAQYRSATDAAGFHLTIFSTLEFLSQLMIIYAHDWAGLASKVREGWMVESKTRSLSAVRNPDDIRVQMQVRRMRRRGEHLYCDADFTVTDDADGRFEVSLKGFLS